MVHDLFPFLIVAAVVCGGVLVFLFIDHLKTERAWKRMTGLNGISAVQTLMTVKPVNRALPPPETPNRFAGFVYKRVKKVGNFFAYAWVKKDKREGGAV